MASPLSDVPRVKLPVCAAAELLSRGEGEGSKDREVGGDKIEYNHMTSAFSIAVTAHPAGGESDSYTA